MDKAGSHTFDRNNVTDYYLYLNHQAIGLMSRVFVNGPGDRG